MSEIAHNTTVMEFMRENPVVPAGIVAAATVAGGIALFPAVESSKTCNNDVEAHLVVDDTANPFRLYNNMQSEQLHDDTVGELASTLSRQRGYIISEQAILADNPSLFPRDGDSVESIDSVDACIAVPRPLLSIGFAMVGEGQTLQEIADNNLVTVDQLRTLNPAYSTAGKDSPLKTGATLRVSETYNTAYSLQAATGNLNEISKQTGVPATDLVLQNVTTFATGQAIEAGSQAFLPLKETYWMRENGVTTESMIAAYAAQGSFDIAPAQTPEAEAAPEQSVPAEAAPSEIDTQTPLSEMPNQYVLTDEQLALIDSLPGRNEVKRQYLRDILQAAMTLYANNSGMNPIAMIAQSLHESTNGDSELCEVNFNCNGMKYSPTIDPDAETVSYDAQEEYSEGVFTTEENTPWLSFDTFEDGVDGYRNFINDRSWFRDALNHQEDPNAFLHALNEGGWWTGHSYFQGINAVVEGSHINELVAMSGIYNGQPYVAE